MSKVTNPYLLTGTWKLRSPFQAKAGLAYTCVAIRSFMELNTINLNPFTNFYAPLGLEVSAYEADLKKGASIVVLLAENGERIYVPDTYIEQYPNLDIGNYKRYILSCELGTLPANIGVEHLTSEIATAVEKKFGRKPTVSVHIGPIKPDSLTKTDRERAEKSRVQTAGVVQTGHGIVHQLQQRLAALQGYTQVLEKKNREKESLEHEVRTKTEALERMTTELEQTKSELTQTKTDLKQANTQLARQEEIIETLRNNIRQLGGQPTA